MLSLPIYVDIHMAAKEIAEINCLDMNKIWDKLLDKWLCPSIQPSEVSLEIWGWRKKASYIIYVYIFNHLFKRLRLFCTIFL